ncbi:MAG: hypothetical protein K2O49_08830, partial [Muribaculaceae bacterium]|nr:hypothetical protein [Muribaculaceae bacterium]
DIITLPSPCTLFSLSFRASNRHSHPSRRFSHLDSDGRRKSVSAPAWSAILILEGNDTLRITVRATEIKNTLSSERATEITALSSSGTRHTTSVASDSGLDPHTGTNTWNFTKTGNTLSISAGKNTLSEIMAFEVADSPLTGFGFEANPAADLLVSNLSFTDDSPIPPPSSPEWKGEEHLNALLKKSKDNMEGYWAIFDMTLEENLLRLGGEYRLAIIREENIYNIIYVSGAAVNKDRWREGMLKGILTPGPFQGVYEVTWIDTEGNPISDSVIAQEEGGLITIQFPRQDSTIRLKKCDRRE